MKVRMAIMSHLSDAEEALNFLNIEKGAEIATVHIKFVKKLIMEYPNTSTEVSEEKINQIFNSIKQN